MKDVIITSPLVFHLECLSILEDQGDHRIIRLQSPGVLVFSTVYNFHVECYGYV